MNTQNNNHAPVSVDELNDRLMDVALAERVGGDRPTELGAKILAAYESVKSENLPTTISGDQSRVIRWLVVGIAATLLIGLTTTSLLPNAAREAPRSSVALTSSADANGRTALQQLKARSRQNASSLHDRSEVVNESAAAMPAAAAANSGPAAPPTVPVAVSDSSNAGQPGVAGQALGRGMSGGSAGPGGGPIGKPAASYGRPETFGVYETRNRAWLTEGGGNESYDRFAFPQAADAKQQQSSSGMTPRYAMAPRVELGPAQDGTLDLYAKSDRPKELAALRAKMPSEHYWKDLQERERLRYDQSGDRYSPIVENSFIKAAGGDAVSTFGIDVDTASYSNVRQFLLEMHQLPPANAVRIEELVNYFHYDYQAPAPTAPGSAGGSTSNAPFAAHVEVGGCPWNAEHRLARIAVKGREMERDKRPQSNLVFLVDVSGSMNEPAKLPLVKYGLEQLTKELGENDHIAIVVYAGNTGVALPSTSGAKQDVILAALQKLEAGGSTAGGAGIQLAYQIAEDNFIKGGTNRVILCTDGDFNVGTTSTEELQKLVATKAKETGVFISTLGYGRGNLNDAMMVAISDHGNGNYHYIDNRTEARRVLVEQMTGTLVTIAKDVKIQVEFNPAKVAAYRLIGYEKRMLKTEDFNNDKKDAGEIGAGHTVTALYEIVPAGKAVEATPAVDELKYQQSAVDELERRKAIADSAMAHRQAVVRALSGDGSGEMLTLKMRYKAPDGDTSQKLEWTVTDGGNSFGNSTEDFRFAAAVAGFGMLLRDSQYKGDLTFKDVLAIAENALGHDEHGYRSEFSEMVREAKRLKGE